MAMYKNRGYCPNNAFWQREANEGYISPHWEETEQLLGDRIGYMVYSEDGYKHEDECYIVDALMGATGTLGIQIASVLKQLIPTCVYAKRGCPIVCTDIIVPQQILKNANEENGKWRCLRTDRKTCCGQEAVSLYEDERYLVAIKEVEGEVHIYLYKK